MTFDEDWADDHGYTRYRDPRTGRIFYTDGDPALECGDVHPDETAVEEEAVVEEKGDEDQ